VRPIPAVPPVMTTISRWLASDIATPRCCWTGSPRAGE
jgi:hypothetical protein